MCIFEIALASYISVANGCRGASVVHISTGWCLRLRLTWRWQHSPESSDCSYQQCYALLVQHLNPYIKFTALYCPCSRPIHCHAAPKEWSGAGGYSPIEVGAVIHFATTILLGRQKGQRFHRRGFSIQAFLSMLHSMMLILIALLYQGIFQASPSRRWVLRFGIATKQQLFKDCMRKCAKIVSFLNMLYMGHSVCESCL